MISDQIVKKYLEEEPNHSDKIKKAKVIALIISLGLLIIFSI